MGSILVCFKHMNRHGTVEHTHAFICFNLIWGPSRRGKGVLSSYISWHFLPGICCYICAFENSKTLSLFAFFSWELIFKMGSKSYVLQLSIKVSRYCPSKFEGRNQWI